MPGASPHDSPHFFLRITRNPVNPEPMVLGRILKRLETVRGILALNLQEPPFIVALLIFSS